MMAELLSPETIDHCGLTAGAHLRVSQLHHYRHRSLRPAGATRIDSKDSWHQYAGKWRVSVDSEPGHEVPR